MTDIILSGDAGGSPLSSASTNSIPDITAHKPYIADLKSDYRSKFIKN